MTCSCDRPTLRVDNCVRADWRFSDRWTVRCIVCGGFEIHTIKPAGGEPWRQSFRQNMAWALKVEKRADTSRIISGEYILRGGV